MFEKPCRILVGRGSVPSGASRAMRSPGAHPTKSCVEQDWGQALSARDAPSGISEDDGLCYEMC